MTTIDLKEMKVQYITDQSGEKNAVVVPMDTFSALLEDLEDLAVAAERSDEQVISHQALLEELKADGLLYN